MLKWILLVFTVLSLSHGIAGAQGLPRPLPDDPYPQIPPEQEPPPRVEVPYTLGGGETGRFTGKSHDFYPRANLNQVLKLRIVGGRENIQIKEVRIWYADYGGEISERSLEGDLRSGRAREVYLGGRPVYRISIKASPIYFWKKPGSFRVDIVAVR
ncbi:hypothetical protein [Bdellovibrio bacteriovorus]|uniref:hypothetical protein n=1 Tax=Bdellovibrio bacteriovorus TaxID=959 RepID=UPI0035A5EEDE